MDIDRRGQESDDVGPVAPDRPVVDGTRASSAELRAEVAREAEVMSAVAGTRTDVAELRAETGATVAALADRLDVGRAVRNRRDAAVARLAPAAAGLTVIVVLVAVARAVARARA